MKIKMNKEIKMLPKHDNSIMIEKGHYLYKNWNIKRYKSNSYSNIWIVKNPIFEDFSLELPTLQEAYKFIDFADFLYEEIKY